MDKIRHWSRWDDAYCKRVFDALHTDPELTAEQKKQVTTGYGAILHPVDLVTLGMKTALGNTRRAVCSE